jgi:hypothetical protein
MNLFSNKHWIGIHLEPEWKTKANLKKDHFGERGKCIKTWSEVKEVGRQQCQMEMLHK